jgi:hypothetical protein
MSSTLGQLKGLNGAWLWTASITTAGTTASGMELLLGETYRIQAPVNDCWVAFGSTQAEADTNAAAAKGELIKGGDPAVIVLISTPEVKFISRVPTIAAAEVRIQRSPTPKA